MHMLPCLSLSLLSHTHSHLRTTSLPTRTHAQFQLCAIALAPLGVLSECKKCINSETKFAKKKVKGRWAKNKCEHFESSSCRWLRCCRCCCCCWFWKKRSLGLFQALARKILADWFAKQTYMTHIAMKLKPALAPTWRYGPRVGLSHKIRPRWAITWATKLFITLRM